MNFVFKGLVVANPPVTHEVYLKSLSSLWGSECSCRDVPFRALRGRLNSFWAPSGASNWSFEEFSECSRNGSIPFIYRGKWQLA